jgi:hypothetical protein
MPLHCQQRPASSYRGGTVNTWCTIPHDKQHHYQPLKIINPRDMIGGGESQESAGRLHGYNKNRMYRGTVYDIFKKKRQNITVPMPKQPSSYEESGAVYNVTVNTQLRSNEAQI